MSKLKLKSSLIFILIYVMLANIGAILSLKVGINYVGQIIMFFTFSVLLLMYTRKYELIKTIGLAKIGFDDVKKSLFYLPLALIALANGVFFFDKTITLPDVILTLFFMILVAFLEELLFRGFLLKSIEQRSTTKTAIIISGVTFGFGHIVNVFNGYSGMSQITQIVLAVLIGIVLAVLFVHTKSIVPGIIFHFIFNTASALSKDVPPLYDYISVGVILLITAIYLIYLSTTAKRIK